MPDDLRYQSELDDLDLAISAASGEAPVGGGGWDLDPSLGATVRAVAALHRTPRPDPGFAARLAAELGRPTGPTVSLPASNQGRRYRPHGLLASPPRLGSRPGFPAPSPRARSAMAHLSLALLLLITLGGVWLSVGGGGLGRRDPSGEVTAQITASLGKTDDHHFVSLRRWSLDPGAVYVGLRRGSTLFLMEQGTLAFQSVSDGEDRTLRPGDTVTASSGSQFALHNRSTQPVVVLIAGFYGQDYFMEDGRLSKGVRFTTIVGGAIHPNLEDEATVTLQRATVAAGRRADAWQTAGRAWIVVDQGQLGLTLTGSSLPQDFASGVERSQAAGALVPLGPDVTVDARNAGDTPLVLTILTITPAGPATTLAP